MDLKWMIAGACLSSAIYAGAAWAQGYPPECNDKPPACAKLDAMSTQYATRMQGLIQSSGPTTHMSSAYAYCGTKVVLEALHVCAATYRAAGKRNCSALIDRDAATLESNLATSKQAYDATAAGPSDIESNCGF